MEGLMSRQELHSASDENFGQVHDADGQSKKASAAGITIPELTAMFNCCKYVDVETATPRSEIAERWIRY